MYMFVIFCFVEAQESNIDSQLNKVNMELTEKLNIIRDNDKRALQMALVENRSHICFVVDCLQSVVGKEMILWEDLYGMEEIHRTMGRQSKDVRITCDFFSELTTSDNNDSHFVPVQERQGIDSGSSWFNGIPAQNGTERPWFSRPYSSTSSYPLEGSKILTTLRTRRRDPADLHRAGIYSTLPRDIASGYAYPYANCQSPNNNSSHYEHLPANHSFTSSMSDICNQMKRYSVTSLPNMQLTAEIDADIKPPNNLPLSQNSSPLRLPQGTILRNDYNSTNGYDDVDRPMSSRNIYGTLTRPKFATTTKKIPMLSQNFSNLYPSTSTVRRHCSSAAVTSMYALPRTCPSVYRNSESAGRSSAYCQINTQQYSQQYYPEYNHQYNQEYNQQYIRKYNQQRDVDSRTGSDKTLSSLDDYQDTRVPDSPEFSSKYPEILGVFRRPRRLSPDRKKRFSLVEGERFGEGHDPVFTGQQTTSLLELSNAETFSDKLLHDKRFERIPLHSLEDITPTNENQTIISN